MHDGVLLTVLAVYIGYPYRHVPSEKGLCTDKMGYEHCQFHVRNGSQYSAVLEGTRAPLEVESISSKNVERLVRINVFFDMGSFRGNKRSSFTMVYRGY